MGCNVLTLLFVLGFGLINCGNAMAVEELPYTLLEQSDDYALRLYSPMIVAETVLEGDLSKASNAGFRRIAAYIFGANKTRAGVGGEKIPMTAPVTIEAQSQKIPMTAPVTITANEGQWRVHFVMPVGSTLENLPVPDDPNVHLREIPAQKMAVLVFSGFTGEERVRQKTADLHSWMVSHGLNTDATPQLARYNPPWILPFFRRNEILIPYP